MRVSKRGQIMIPKKLRDRFGLHPSVEVEVVPTDGGLLVRRRSGALHPVDRAYGILGARPSTDEYLEQIRGR